MKSWKVEFSCESHENETFQFYPELCNVLYMLRPLKVYEISCNKPISTRKHEKYFSPLGTHVLVVGTRIPFFSHGFQVFVFPDPQNIRKNIFHHLAHTF